MSRIENNYLEEQKKESEVMPRWPRHCNEQQSSQIPNKRFYCFNLDFKMYFQAYTYTQTAMISEMNYLFLDWGAELETVLQAKP